MPKKQYVFDEDDYSNIRDKALILVGFYSFCRRSELLGMKFEHLNFESDGVQVLIPFSKTDQTGQGRMIFLPATNDNYCPVRALNCLLYTSPSPRDLSTSRMPSSA